MSGRAEGSAPDVNVSKPEKNYSYSVLLIERISTV